MGIDGGENKVFSQLRVKISSGMIFCGCILGLFGAFFITIGVVFIVWKVMRRSITYFLQVKTETENEESRMTAANVVTICRYACGGAVMLVGIFFLVIAVLFMCGGMLLMWPQEMKASYERIRLDMITPNQ